MDLGTVLPAGGPIHLRRGEGSAGLPRAPVLRPADGAATCAACGACYAGAPWTKEIGYFRDMVQSMSKSPLTTVKERFGADRKEAKKKLVAAVKEAAGKDLWLDRLNDEKGLEHVSNRKLLHLEQVLGAVRETVGSRDGLIDAIAKLQGRHEDAAYKARLGERSTPSLWDRYQAVQSRSAGDAAK